MAELVGGALLGAVVSELLKSVLHAKNTLLSFKPSLEQLSETLESVRLRVEKIRGIDLVDKGPEISKLIMKLKEGKALVEECASVKFWDYYSQHRYSKKILELDNYLRRFFQMDVQAAIWCDVVQICWDNNKILGKVTHIIDLLTKERGTSCDSINDGAEEGDQGVYNLEGGTSSSTTRGTLEVLLVDAYKLKDTDFFGKMDPYVIIQFGNQKRKSTVARGEGKAPVWNEKFTFDVEYPDNIRDELNLTIMDKDWFSRDDFVGESTINLTDVLSFGVKNGRSEIRVSSPVLLNKTYSGEIRVGISFTRKDGNADDKASYLGGWKQ